MTETVLVMVTFFDGFAVTLADVVAEGVAVAVAVLVAHPASRAMHNVLMSSFFTKRTSLSLQVL